MYKMPMFGSGSWEEQHINSVLLDTSFLIRLLNEGDALHAHAREYFRYFLERKINLKCSTIAIAEYCVKGNCTELPLRNMQIVPFNFDHAVMAGQLMKIFRENKNTLGNTPVTSERAVVINDINLFAQAHVDQSIDAYITSDTESNKLYSSINTNHLLSFNFYDIHVPCNEAFGYILGIFPALPQKQ